MEDGDGHKTSLLKYIRLLFIQNISVSDCLRSHGEFFKFERRLRYPEEEVDSSVTPVV